MKGSLVQVTKSALSAIRYSAVIFSDPYLRWDTVAPPSFLESYEVCSWTYWPVYSAINFTVEFMAPTDPSPPNPQLIHYFMVFGRVGFSS